ncbi:hypothetical protein QOZ80_8AG0629500 [Eleusine coracana subsp. coracana]|nr:hypothetical protein QOZ80_8AG0629490 [Eleusine coracana subsp. coracana]KAK3123369.1 hypothetical protein QOZ80_8AG0629500 [Eleusine coracana subsp. coracana]
MSSPLVTGGCIALKSKLNGKYLRYAPQNGKILEVSGEDALSPYTRFHAEPSKKHDGHVHIKCCYNNKYWIAREVNQEWCLMGDANEPQEDLSDPSCTLLWHEPSSYHVSLQHARLKSSVYMLPDAHPTGKTLKAGSLLLGNKDKLNEDACMFSVINLEHMVLPKHVCFKGDNGKYLSASRASYNYFKFSSDDNADPTVRNIIHTNSDGTIRIYSSHYNKFWRRSPNWIWGDSDDTTSRNPDTVFRAVLLGDGGKCALQNLGNNNFCKRLTTEGKTDCLNAAVPTITKEAQLELQETVISRRIYDVEYHTNDANIHGLKPRTFYSKTVANNSNSPTKSKLSIEYSVTTERRWDSNVSWKLGVTTTITAGVPVISEGSIEISSEFSGSYTWGKTQSHTEKYSIEEEIELLPHTEITISVVATEGNCDIPFSYYQEDILTTGEKIVTKMDDGIYYGVNCYGFKTVIN